MRRHLAIVVVLVSMLASVGVGSSAASIHARARATALTAVQREKRLGPKPTPRWYWHWLQRRLAVGRVGEHPRRPPHRFRPKEGSPAVPRWALRRLHFFLLARAEAAKRKSVTHATQTGTTGAAPTSDGESYEEATSYTRTRPSFTPTRTIGVSSASELDAAIANLQPGDLVEATKSFAVSGETVIKNRLAAPAELDLSGVYFVYSGGDALPAVWLDNAENLFIYGGDLSTADTGGTCLLDYGSQHVLWWGFEAHDCGSGGFSAMPVGAAVAYDDFQGEITRVGENLARDPHMEKGSGLHGVLLWDSGNGYAFTNNRFAFYCHDIAVGAAVEVGNSVAANATGNVLYLKAVGLTFVSTIQTGGNGIEYWGALGLGMDVKYLEVDDAEGRAIDTNGLYPGVSLTGVTVEYGRASDTNQNARLNEPDNQLPWDWRGAIVYEQVRPAR